ncbi:MAG: hypothetical protein NTY39_08675 [Campylobacterales bacterium]|nr:hypothetical protein [Campylobacterales bacterium]
MVAILHEGNSKKTADNELLKLIIKNLDLDEKECIETFLDCSKFKSKENHKAILNQVYKMAYPNAPFNFAHQNFTTLKQKLQDLFS